MWDICQKAISQKNLILQGTGNESRDFIHAVDIARAIEIICDRAPMQGEVYNLGSGQEVTIAKLAAIVLISLEKNMSLEFSGITSKGDPINWQADISQIISIGFTSTIQLKDGIKNFANWCKAELGSI